ncbi:MAG: hypothetical protein JWN48_435 [Myxococcaceae bacterium]|nr:hypothetical protein [Myxococcaceae bacterium]
MTAIGKTALALVSCALTACAFFGKAEPINPRFFDPVRIDLPGGERASAVSGPGLKLGHIVGASHLRELIAYHVSEHELGFYEKLRWTERPEDLMRRALAHALFEERGIKNEVSGFGPVLEVAVTDFSELLKPTHAVRVRARVVLIDQRTVRMERTFSTEQAVAKGDDFSLVADAMSEALERCVGEIADAVKAQLATPAQTPAQPVQTPAQ